MSEEQTCPRCQISNSLDAEACPKCGLNLRLFDFIMNCLMGHIPQVSSPAILEPGELPYFASDVHMLAQRTETLTKHNFIGTRVRLGGMPVYFGQSTPQKQSSEILADAGSGEFTLTNHRIIVVSDKETFSIPLSKIVDFEHYGSGIQIFVEGKHGGMIYQVSDPWQLWILLFALLKSKGITPTNEAQTEELRHFALHICEETTANQTASQRAEWVETIFHSDPATFIWLIICPPVGFYLLYQNISLGMFTKAVLGCVGLYALVKWIEFFR